MSVTEEDKHGKVQYLFDKYCKILVPYTKNELRSANCPNYHYDAYDIVRNTFLNLIKYMPESIESEKRSPSPSFVFDLFTVYISLSQTLDISSYSDSIILNRSCISTMCSLVSASNIRTSSGRFDDALTSPHP